MSIQVSPKYLMSLVKRVHDAILAEYNSPQDVRYYIWKWHEQDEYNHSWENFAIVGSGEGEINLLSTLHLMSGEILLKIAIDLGIETPDYIPSVATFRNVLSSSYKTARTTFDKAFKQIETHPDIAVGLANSALESIIKEILKDERIKFENYENKTLYSLTQELLKEFKLFPGNDMPKELKNIGSSLLTINQSIEELRSSKTDFHGKIDDSNIIKDTLYAHFIVNVVTSIGLFLDSYYRKKFVLIKNTSETNTPKSIDDLPF